jgi:hypothetical protein
MQCLIAFTKYQPSDDSDKFEIIEDKRFVMMVSRHSIHKLLLGFNNSGKLCFLKIFSVSMSDRMDYGTFQ